MPSQRINLEEVCKSTALVADLCIWDPFCPIFVFMPAQRINLEEVCKSTALVADLCIWTLFAQFLCLCHHKELI